MDPYLDVSKTVVDVYPLAYNSMKFHYHTSLNCDGTHYIGSTFYARGDITGIGPLWDMVQYMSRYKQLDKRAQPFLPPYDFTDPLKWPKFSAHAAFMIDMFMAGGYQPAVGDVGGM